MIAGGLHHLALQVRELAKAEAFYAGLLGLPVIARHEAQGGGERAIWVGLPGGGFLALERCDGTREPQSFRDPRPGLHLLALTIPAEARDAWETKLAAAGPPQPVTPGVTFYVGGPAGHPVGLSHHPVPRT